MSAQRRFLTLATLLAACTSRSGSPSAAQNAPAQNAASASPASPAFVETSLGNLRSITPADLREIAWSDSGRAAAWVDREAAAGRRERVMVNGVPGPWHDHIRDLDLAHDGVTPVYVANDGGKTDRGDVHASVDGGSFRVVIGDHASDALDSASIFHSADWRAPHFIYRVFETATGRSRVVAEGKPGPWVDKLDTLHLDWLPDGRPVYRVALGGRAHVVIGDDLGPDYKDVRALQVSASGVVAYVAVGDDDRPRLVRDRVAGEPADQIDELRISPPGVVVAQVTRGEVIHALVGDRELGPYDRVMNAAFSERGGHIAFMAGRDKKLMVVVDGEPGPPFAMIAGSFNVAFFSPTGAHVAYVGRPMDEVRSPEVVMRDGKQEGPWDRADQLTWSADGEHLAYQAMQKGAHVAVLDGQAGPPFDEVGGFQFAGDTLVYEARQANRWCIVRGGTPACYDDVGEPNLIAADARFNFTVDASGKHVAFRARKGGSWLVVVDGVEGPPCDAVWPPVFSSDGTQVGYGALVGHELWWKVGRVP